MKKNEKVPDFSLEISKTIFHPTHPVRKKMKKMTWGALNGGKMARKWFFRKMGKNNVKRNKKTRKNSNFSVKMSQTIFHPTHPVRKK